MHNYSHDKYNLGGEILNQYSSPMLEQGMQGIISTFEHGGDIAQGNYEMMLSQAKSIKHHIQELSETLKREKNIEAWVVSKMENISQSLSDITHYLDGKSEYAKGGKTKEKIYIEFLNKRKNFQKDKKYFDGVEKAIDWGRKNLSNFNMDMIRYEYADGGPTFESLFNESFRLSSDEKILSSIKVNGPRGKWDCKVIDMNDDGDEWIIVTGEYAKSTTDSDTIWIPKNQFEEFKKLINSAYLESLKKPSSGKMPQPDTDMLDYYDSKISNDPSNESDSAKYPTFDDEYYENGGEFGGGGMLEIYDVTIVYPSKSTRQGWVMNDKLDLKVSAKNKADAKKKAMAQFTKLHQGVNGRVTAITPEKLPFNLDDAILDDGGEFGRGGLARVYIENKDTNFDHDHYKGIFDDIDLDGIPNADDPEPQKPGDTNTIEQVKFTKVFDKVIDTKSDLDKELDSFVEKLKDYAPENSAIYARTKTPYSIFNKLVDTRLLDEKKGLKDLVGTTIAFDKLDDLKKANKLAQKGFFGKVLESHDYYENPKHGYRAYHYIIDQNGVPIELQLKTTRMKDVNILSHDAYKQKNLNSDFNHYLTLLAHQADMGVKQAITEYNNLMGDKSLVKEKLMLKTKG